MNLTSEPTIKNLENFIHLAKLVAFIHISEDQFEKIPFNPKVHEKCLYDIAELFTKKSAEEFLRNLNFLYFLRKKIIPENFLEKNFSQFIHRLNLFLDMKDEHFYEIKTIREKCTKENYERIFNYLYYNGFSKIEDLQTELKIEKRHTLMNMIFLYFEFIKPDIEASNPSIIKKRKLESLIMPIKNNFNKGVHKKYIRKSKINNILASQNVLNIRDLKLPLMISSSLKLIQLGQVNLSPYYHTEHNIFPIKYRSIRIFNSMKNKGVKCEYLCEISEGEGKPLYRVASSEDQDNPVIRNSSTECWKYIFDKVNQISNFKKEKMPISGTERFGLLDPIVISLIENLPNANQCKKYIFKNKIN